jgi:hypothetical protein
MATDLMVGLVNRPGSLQRASEALGRAGVNIEVEDAERARRALIDAGLEIQAERRVVVTAIENRPGSAAEVLRRVADAAVSIDLLYATADGRLVLGGDDVSAIKTALG